jgi:hypothetical protein
VIFPAATRLLIPAISKLRQIVIVKSFKKIQDTKRCTKLGAAVDDETNRIVGRRAECDDARDGDRACEAGTNEDEEKMRDAA